MNITWNADEYTKNFDFVPRYGEGLFDLIEAPQNGLIVDLGCGNGALSEKIRKMGYRVLGLDASPAMIEVARSRHPDLTFSRADALEFRLEEKADVIFSNAVLHWIEGEKQERLVENIAAQIKNGGYLVCEFGGKSCAERVHAALEHEFQKRNLVYRRNFYFPTIGEYAPILERHGLRVEYAVLFDRPTEQKTDSGLEDWIRMFNMKPFEGIRQDVQDEIIREAVERLRPTLWQNGKWIVDYVRIRIKARKVSE